MSRQQRVTRIRAFLRLALGAMLLQTLAFGAPADKLARPLTVVMISLDGTRPHDVRPDTLPTLVELAARGRRAERMVPSIPTNTFPNHVTLVTGVEPERHGIVNNSFRDPERGWFRKRDIPEWIAVEPLWAILDRAGLPSASYYWVGSEGPWTNGHGPRHWKAFSNATKEDVKVAQILAWLDLEDPDSRPRLVTSWFRGADHAGHHDGPDTEAVVRSLRAQDAAIAALVEGIEARGLRETTLLLFVSDHGMRSAERRVDVGSLLAAAGVDGRVVGIGGFATLELGEEARRDAAAALARASAAVREEGVEIVPRAAAPASLRVGNPRFGDAVVMAPPGVAIVTPKLSLKGFHGYAPEEPSMAALLIASGGGLTSGPPLPEVRSIDVAPTILTLLGVEVPAWMQGRPIDGLVEALFPPAVGGPGETSARLADLLEEGSR